MALGAQTDAAGMRRLKQIGIDHVLMAAAHPVDRNRRASRIDHSVAGGLTLCNMMISGFYDVIWGRPGADAQIADSSSEFVPPGSAGCPLSNTTSTRTG